MNACLENAAAIDAPQLLVQGAEDALVDPRGNEEILAAARMADKVKLVATKGAHGSTAAETIVAELVAWLRAVKDEVAGLVRELARVQQGRSGGREDRLSALGGRHELFMKVGGWQLLVASKLGLLCRPSRMKDLSGISGRRREIRGAAGPTTGSLAEGLREGTDLRTG